MHQLFTQYQPQLVSLANHWAGKKFLGIDKECTKEIVGLTPNSYIVKSGKNKYTAMFRTYNIFWKRLGAALTLLDIARDKAIYRGLSQYAGLLNYAGILEDGRFPNIWLASTGDLFTGATDGWLDSGQQTSYATARNATSGNVSNTGTALSIDNSDYNATPASGFQVGRALTNFNTGGTIPSGATIDSGTVSLYGVATTANDDTTNITFIQSTITGDPALVAGDLDSYSALNTPTEGAIRLALSSWSTTAYNNFTMNASALSWVGTGSGNYLNLMWRLGMEIDNVAPGAENRRNLVNASTSEAADTTQDPKCSITYTSLQAYLGKIW